MRGAASSNSPRGIAPDAILFFGHSSFPNGYVGEKPALALSLARSLARSPRSLTRAQAVSSAQAVKNTINLKGSAQLVAEFFAYSINTILYQRGARRAARLRRKRAPHKFLLAAG
jgi:hypothetical protein